MKCLDCNGRGFIEYQHGLAMIKCKACQGTGEIDDSISGTKPANSNIGSGNPSQPKLIKKPKAKKTTRK